MQNKKNSLNNHIRRLFGNSCIDFFLCLVHFFDINNAPVSLTIIEPVILRASSEAINDAKLAISIGSAAIFNKVRFLISSSMFKGFVVMPNER